MKLTSSTTSAAKRSTKRSSQIHPPQQSNIDSYTKTTLPNGVRVISEFVPSVASFSLGVWIDIGTRDEKAPHYGTAHFIEHMLFRRTTSRSSKQIATAFESVGAYVNAFTSKEQTCYYVRALSNHFATTMELLADVVQNPAFNPKDVQKERAVIIEEIKSYDDEPEEHILDIAESTLFGNTSMGSSIIGTIKSVQSIDADILRAFHAKHYIPSNIVIAVSGNIPHQQAVREAEKYFSGMSAVKNSKQRRKPTVKQKTTTTLQRNFQQAHCCFIRETDGIRSPYHYALSLINTLLGDGMSSRLYSRVREKSGLAYTVYSGLQLLTDCGVLNIYAGMEHKNAQKCIDLIRKELQHLADGGVTKSELSRAKEQLKSSIIMGLESMSSRMQTLAKSELEDGSYESLEQTIERIDAVDVATVNSLVATLCIPSSWSIVTFEPE